MTGRQPVRPDLLGASIETLKAAADALLSDRAVTLAASTVHEDLYHLRAWAHWADSHGERRIPADPVAIAAHVVDMFQQRRPANAVQCRIRALWRAHGSPSGPLDPTAYARQVFRAMVAEERIVTPIGPAPVLCVEEFVQMVEALEPAEKDRERHAQLVLGWALRHADASVVAVAASDLRFAAHDRWVVVHPPATRASDWPAIVLRQDPDPLRCPVRAARFLARHRPDRLLTGQFRIRGLRTGTRNVKFGERWVQFHGWNQDDFSYAVDLLAIPLRRAARDRAYICVGYAVAPQSGNLEGVWIEDFRSTDTGYALAHPQPKSGTVMLEPRDDALDPVSATREWLSFWPFPSGPFLPGDLHPDQIPEGGPRGGMSMESQRRLLRRAAAAANLRVVPTPRSLARSRVAHEWRKNKDIVAICDLLGNQDPFRTWERLLAMHPLLFSAAIDMTERLSLVQGPGPAAPARAAEVAAGPGDARERTTPTPLGQTWL